MDKPLTCTVQLAPIIAEARAQAESYLGPERIAQRWDMFLNEAFKPYIEDVAASKVINPVRVVANDWPNSMTFEYEIPRPHGAMVDVLTSCKNCGAPNSGAVVCSHCGTHGFYRSNI